MSANSPSNLHDHLVGNAQSAMMAGIEIYNKPLFQYRDECTVILLLNAWELLLKAVLARNGEPIHYAKRPDRTLSWKDAFSKAERHLPDTVTGIATRRNLDFLGSYRDKAIHFYNDRDIALVVYSLAQTSVVNFRDVLQAAFAVDLADRMNWRLLPIGVRPPVDVVSYIQGSAQMDGESAAGKFVKELVRAAEDVTSVGEDTGRLLTVFNIKLESVKKIGDADVVVALDDDSGQEGTRTVVRRQDPNESHPLLQRDIVSRIDKLQGVSFTTHTCQAIVWKYRIKRNLQYCWIDKQGYPVRYSNDLIALMKRLSASEIQEALADYREHQRLLRTGMSR